MAQGHRKLVTELKRNPDGMSSPGPGLALGPGSERQGHEGELSSQPWNKGTIKELQVPGLVFVLMMDQGHLKEVIYVKSVPALS